MNATTGRPLTAAQRTALDAYARGDPTGGVYVRGGRQYPAAPLTIDTLLASGFIEGMPEDGMDERSPFRFRHHRLTEAGRRARDAR